MRRYQSIGGIRGRNGLGGALVHLGRRRDQNYSKGQVARAARREGLVHYSLRVGPRGVCFCLSVLTGFSVVFGSAAAGAGNIPTQYLGVWSSTDCRVPKSESDIGEFPYLVVTPRGYKAHETSCIIKSVSNRPVPNSDALTFSCEGEGEQWTSKEVWSLKQRKLELGDSTLSEQVLVTKREEYEETYNKCAASVVPRKETTSSPANTRDVIIFNYSCKVHGKTYPLRLDETKKVLEWRGKRYSIVSSSGSPSGSQPDCAKYGWHVEGNGTSFDFCSATQGYAAIQDKDGNDRVKCNLQGRK